MLGKYEQLNFIGTIIYSILRNLHVLCIEIFNIRTLISGRRYSILYGANDIFKTSKSYTFVQNVRTELI